MRTRLLLIAVPLVAACGDVTPSPERVDLDLVLVDSIGLPGLPGDDEDLIFGQLVSAALHPNGTIYVVDRGARRAVVLDEGEARGFLGSPGEGPGEFGRPIDLAIEPDGSVTVLDAEAGRVTRFDPATGSVLGEFTGVWSRNVLAHRTRRDTAWLSLLRFGSDTLPVLEGITLSGTRVSGPPTHPNDADFPGTSALDATADRLIASSPRPGVWWEFGPQGWRRIGSPLIPDAGPEIDTEVRPGLVEVTPSPVGVGEIALAGDSLVLQLARHWPGIEPGVRLADIDRRYFLAVFRADGEPIDTIGLPQSVWNGCLDAGPNETIVMCSNDPYPRVLIYQLRSRPQSPGDVGSN